MKYNATYPLTGSQLTTFYTRLVSSHKQALQIPTSIKLDRPLDRTLLAKALEVENQRNDSLRLRFKKVGMQRTVQYFVEPGIIEEIEFIDFSGKTEEELNKFLEKFAQKAVPWYRKRPWNFIHFRMPDGNDGFAFTVFHLNMDMAAVCVFYRDLLAVYHALERGENLPEALGSYEESIIKELEKAEDENSSSRHEEFFREFFGKYGPAFYAGADHGRELKAARDKNPEQRGVNPMGNLMHDKAELCHFTIDAETVKKIDNFAKAKEVPFQTVMSLGLRLWLSKINEESEDVTISVLVNRRCKLDELNMGGCRVMSMPLRTVFPGSMSFNEALTKGGELLYQLLRHSDLPTIKVLAIAREFDKSSLATSTMLFSCFPPGTLTMPEPWEVQLSGANPGYFCSALYSIMIPDDRKGIMDCYYWYLPYRIKGEEVGQLHDNMLRAIEAGMENPELTLKEIMDQLHD